MLERQICLQMKNTASTRNTKQFVLWTLTSTRMNKKNLCNAKRRNIDVGHWLMPKMRSLWWSNQNLRKIINQFPSLTMAKSFAPETAYHHWCNDKQNAPASQFPIRLSLLTKLKQFLITMQHLMQWQANEVMKHIIKPKISFWRMSKLSWDFLLCHNWELHAKSSLKKKGW